ncbi:MAG: hypothetical protein LBS41_03515 [Streptococcaceae bacterium]|nr:hypothetical protein [Streptococcaceae bacterium]
MIDFLKGSEPLWDFLSAIGTFGATVLSLYFWFDQKRYKIIVSLHVSFGLYSINNIMNCNQNNKYVPWFLKILIKVGKQKKFRKYTSKKMMFYNQPDLQNITFKVQNKSANDFMPIEYTLELKTIKTPFKNGLSREVFPIGQYETVRGAKNIEEIGIINSWTTIWVDFNKEIEDDENLFYMIKDKVKSNYRFKMRIVVRDEFGHEFKSSWIKTKPVPNEMPSWRRSDT